MNSNLITLCDASALLVVTGSSYREQLTAPDFNQAVTFRWPFANGGYVDLDIEAPTDLTGFADLSAAALLKPVCLPLAITSMRAGVVSGRINDEASVHRLAQRILAAIAAESHPAHRAGVPPRSRKERNR